MLLFRIVDLFLQCGDRNPYRTPNAFGWQHSTCNYLIDLRASYAKRLCYLWYAQQEPLWWNFYGACHWFCLSLLVLESTPSSVFSINRERKVSLRTSVPNKGSKCVAYWPICSVALTEFSRWMCSETGANLTSLSGRCDEKTRSMSPHNSAKKRGFLAHFSGTFVQGLCNDP